MIISESTYLDLDNYQYDDTALSVNAIPVLENSRINLAMVSINNLSRLTEDYGCDYEDAFYAVAEYNQINLEDLAVMVEDWKLIETPELAGMVPNIVVKPISENNIVYQFCDYAVDALAEDAITDEEFYDAMLDEFSLGEFIRGMGDAQLKGNPIQVSDVDGSYTDDNGVIWHPDPSTGVQYGKTPDGKFLKKTTRLVRKNGHMSKKAAAGYVAAGAGVALGASLAAKKIAALRKQQKKNPSMRGRIQKVIDALKKKLHRK